MLGIFLLLLLKLMFLLFPPMANLIHSDISKFLVKNHAGVIQQETNLNFDFERERL